MPRKKEYIKEEVLEKAMHTFWANGYENTTVRKLEEEMGINQFSIYSSFGNKKELFLDVLKCYKEFINCNVIKELLKSEGKKSDLEAFLLNYGHSIRSGVNPNGCLMVNTAAEIGSDDPEISKCLKSYFDFIKLSFCHVLEKAKTNGELTSEFDIEKNASFLLVSMQGLSVYAKLYNEDEINKFVDSMLKNLN